MIDALFGSLFGGLPGGVTYSWRPDDSGAANIYAHNRDSLGRVPAPYKVLSPGIFWQRGAGRTHAVTIRRETETVADWGAIAYLAANTGVPT